MKITYSMRVQTQVKSSRCCRYARYEGIGEMFEGNTCAVAYEARRYIILVEVKSDMVHVN